MVGEPQVWGLSKTVVVVASLVLAFLLPTTSFAVTSVSSSNFPNTGDVHWTVAGSPYVVTASVSKRYGTFTVDPGVVVKFVSGATLSTHADVVTTIVGTPDEPIYFTSYKDDSVAGDTNGDLDATAPAPGDWGSTAFGGGSANNAMRIEYLKVRFAGSSITNTTQGAVRYALAISYPWYSGSPGRAYTLQHVEVSESLGAGLYVSVGQGNSLSVTQSSFFNNATRGLLRHYTTNLSGQLVSGAVGATDNWWGDASGPYHATLNPTGVGNPVDPTVLHVHLGGSVSFIPWLTTNPIPDPVPAPTCCSSVLFLPGFMASRLYQGTERVWEPWFSTDVTQLLLDQNGSPIIPGIYAKEVIDSAYGVDIYESFLEDLSTITGPEEGKIREWWAYPYDWRLVVNNPSILDALVAQLEDLATDSKTGKVSIVAHSNGGLLAKALAVHLGDTRATALLDKLILVGSPQVGTPKAVGALLHGYEQGIPSFLPLLLSEEEARHLAKNMPGAYGLVPSQAYFNTIVESMIHFDGTGPFIDQMMAAYERVVGNMSEYRSYLTGGEGRTDATYADLVHPAVLHTQQFDDAQALHARIDAWTPPTGIEVYQIAGWGEETVKGFEYIGSGDTVRVVPELTVDGDGTVVTPSALYMSDTAPNVHRFWFNLAKENGILPGPVRTQHATIFSLDRVRDLLNLLVLESVSVTNDYTTTEAPQLVEANRLRFFLHSPLNLVAVDQLGNTVSKDVINLPGAHFEKFGEVQYISVPADAVPTLKLDAYASGSFTLDIQEVQGDTVVATTTFFGIPNTENTQVSMSFPNGTISGAGPLEIDKDGDGDTDVSLMPKLNDVVILDETPPVSQATVTGTSGINGWYLSPVSVHITAVDAGSGVKSSYYSLDGGATTTGSIVTIDSNGTHTLAFYSDDLVGNTEVSQYVTVRIDTTRPEAVIQVSLAKQDLQVTGTDAIMPVTVSAARTITSLADHAGNVTKLELEKTYKREVLVSARLKSLQYNNEPTVSLPSSFTYEWDSSGALVTQTVVSENQRIARAQYDKVRNRTTIQEFSASLPFKTVTLPGLVIIKLTTNSGHVSYSW